MASSEVEASTPTPSMPVSSSPATVTAQQATSPSDESISTITGGIEGDAVNNLNDAMDSVAAAAAEATTDNVYNDATTQPTTRDDLSSSGADLGGGGPAATAAAAATATATATATTTAIAVPPVPEVFKQAAEKFNPVAAAARDGMKTAAETLAVTFNEKIGPKTAAGVAEVRQGWKKNVMPGLTSGGARMASFFGKVGEKMKETNSKLREKNDTFRKMGDGFSHGAATTLEAMKAGGQELRTEIKAAAAEVRSAASEVILTRQSAAPAPGVAPLANFDAMPLDKATAAAAAGAGAAGTTGEGKRISPAAAAAAAAEQELRAETAAADAHLGGGDGAGGSGAGAGVSAITASTASTSSATAAGTAAAVTAGNPAGVAAAAIASAPSDPGSVLNVPLEQLAAWDAHTSPVPYVVLAFCHWLSASCLQTEGIFRGDGGNRGAVERLTSKFQRNPTSLVPVGCDPMDVAAALKLYLGSLPEPLLTFSLYTAVVQSGEADVSYMAELTQLLPRARRATLECVLSLLSRVAAHSPMTRMDARALASALAPVVAWPRSGRLARESLDKIAAAEAAAAMTNAAEENSGGGGGSAAAAGGAAAAAAKAGAVASSRSLLDSSVEKAAKEMRAVANALQYLIENYDGIFQSDSFSLDDDDDADDL